jgi:Flp pilus assembly protein TadD
MEKMYLKKKYFMSIFFMLIFCLMSSPSFSAPKSSKPAPKEAKSQSLSYATTPFDDTWKSLPKNYNGHDVVAVHKSLSKNLDIKKDEFETEAQFEKRKKEAWDKPILGKMTGRDNFAFVYEPETMYDAENSQFTIKIDNFQNIGVVLQESRIGEDKRGQDTVKRIHRDEKRKRIIRGKGTYNTDTSEAIFGAAIDAVGILEFFVVDFPKEDWPMLQQIAVDMPLEEARKNKEKIRVLFVGDPVSHSPREARVFAIFTVYVNYLKLNLKKVIIFNYQTGEIYRTIDKSDQAYRSEIKTRDFSKAIELDPNNAHYYSKRGDSYAQLKQYDNAIRDFSKAIELDPNKAIYYGQRGYSFMRLKQYDNAIRDYSSAIERDPNGFLYYGNRGDSYATLKQYDNAIRDYSKAIELNPNKARYYGNRGYSYAQLKQYDNAIRDFSSAIERDPNKAIYYTGRGDSYMKLKQYDDANRDFSKAKAIKLDPQ